MTTNGGNEMSTLNDERMYRRTVSLIGLAVVALCLVALLMLCTGCKSSCRPPPGALPPPTVAAESAALKASGDTLARTAKGLASETATGRKAAPALPQWGRIEGHGAVVGDEAGKLSAMAAALKAKDRDILAIATDLAEERQARDAELTKLEKQIAELKEDQSRAVFGWMIKLGAVVIAVGVGLAVGRRRRRHDSCRAAAVRMDVGA
jgi:uncharacterized protein YbaA (DUF1428 family)